MLKGGGGEGEVGMEDRVLTKGVEGGYTSNCKFAITHYTPLYWSYPLGGKR